MIHPNKVRNYYHP